MIAKLGMNSKYLPTNLAAVHIELCHNEMTIKC